MEKTAVCISSYRTYRSNLASRIRHPSYCIVISADNSTLKDKWWSNDRPASFCQQVNPQRQIVLLIYPLLSHITYLYFVIINNRRDQPFISFNPPRLLSLRRDFQRPIGIGAAFFKANLVFPVVVLLQLNI